MSHITRGDQIAAMDLRGLSIFVRVAELRSFVRAARDLAMSQSGVSNAISRLEERVGVALLVRTTRSVNLTEDGAAFFDRCKQILAELEEAEAVLTKARLQPSGRLRISLPGSFGRLMIVPLLGPFQADYPDIDLHVGITDRYVDLVEEGVDVAIRFGALQDSNLIARQLTRALPRTVGTPEYFARHRRPKCLSDLGRHNCLALTYHETRRVREWLFRRDGTDHVVTPRGSMSFNDGAALHSAVLAGYGIGQIHNFYVDAAIGAGQLLPVLKEYDPPGSAISLVYPPARHLSPKVRAFTDFMVSRFHPR